MHNRVVTQMALGHAQDLSVCNAGGYYYCNAIQLAVNVRKQK